jgi:outer membrane protein
MRIKIVTLALVTLAAAAMPLGAAHAQAKIGVVNVQRLLQEAPQAQAASQALENEFANRRRDLENQQRDLKAREDKLQKDGAVMAEAERRNAEKTLRDGQRDLARKQNEFLEDLNVRRNEALGQLQRTVLQEVQTYAKSANLDVVVADALYASPAVDITGQVLAALALGPMAGMLLQGGLQFSGPVMLRVALLLLVGLAALLHHCHYLLLVRFDYAYNMQACICLGVGQALLWLLWAD